RRAHDRPPSEQHRRPRPAQPDGANSIAEPPWVLSAMSLGSCDDRDRRRPSGSEQRHRLTMPPDRPVSARRLYLRPGVWGELLSFLGTLGWAGLLTGTLLSPQGAERGGLP